VRGKPLSQIGTGSEAHVNARLRRASKLGLSFATGQGNTVRFVLDQIDMSQVTRKNHRDDRPTPTGKNRAVTGSELRYLYRHRNDDAIMSKIEFYFQGSPTVPPWTNAAPWNQSGGGRPSDYELWAAYAPRSEQGAQLQPPGLLLASNSNGPGPAPGLPSVPRPSIEAASLSSVGEPAAATDAVQGPALPSAIERDIAWVRFHLDAVAQRAASGELEDGGRPAVMSNLALFRDLEAALGRLRNTGAATQGLRHDVRQSIDALRQRLAELDEG
jgi:hypothetical protein